MKTSSFFKRKLLFLIVVTISLSATSQTVWAPPGAVWHYDYSNFWIEGYVKITYTGDTTINSQTCKVLKKDYVIYNHLTHIIDTATFGYEYTYASGNKVFHYRYGHFFILYDFDAQAMDTLVVAGWDTISGYGFTCTDSLGMVQLDSIGQGLYNGQSLNWYSVSPYGPTDWVMYGKIAERIGAVEAYMIPEVACVIDVYEGGFFRCYYDSAFGLYQATISPCDYLPTGIDDLEKTAGMLDIYPNPASNSISLYCFYPEACEFQYQVFNMQGLCVKQWNSNNSSPSVDVSGLQKGLYLISVSSPGKEKIVRRFVKE